MPKGFEDVLVVQYQRAKIVQEKKDAYLEFVFDGHPSKFKISKSNVSSQELQTLLEDKLADFCQQIAINQEVAFLEEFTRLYQKGYPIDQLDLAGINTEAYVGFLSVQGFKQELLSSENAEDLYFDYLASLPSQALQLEEVSAELSALVELTLQAKIGYPVEWLAEQAKTLDEAIIAFYLKNFAEFDREKLQDEDASEISGGGKDYKVFCQLLNKLSKTYAAKSSRVPTAWEIEYDGVVSYKLITGDEVESFSTSDELSGEIARQTNNHWLLQTEDQVSYWILHKGWFSSKLASYSLERFVAEVQAKEKQEAASRRRWAIGLGLSTTFAGVQDLFASAFYGRRGVAEDNFDFIGEESVTISSGALALPSGAGYVQRESTSQSNSSQLLSSIVNYKSSVDFLSFPNSFHQLTNYAINSLVPFVAMRKMGLSSSVSLFVSGVFGALKTVSGGVTNTTVTLQFDAPTAAPVRISIENSTMGITFAPSTGMAITDVKDLPYGLSISTPLVSTSIKLISNVQAMNYLSDYLLIGTSGGSISCYNLTTLTVAKSFPVSGAVYEFSQLPGSSILWIAGASGLYAWNISGTPTSVGSYAGNLIGAVAVNNGLVYAADGLSTNLVRIISQTTITQVRSITIPSGTIKQLCALNNNALAVAASTAGVYLYANVDSSPTLAATILVPSAISVGSYGNYLFIVDTSGLFYVVDIASLSAPRIIYFSSGIFSGRTLYVTSDGAMVYVTQANGVVNFYSIVDLPRVTFVGQRSVPDLVLKMAATPTQTLVTLGQGLLGIRKDNYSQRVVKGDLIQAQFNLGTLQTVRSVTVSGTPQQIVKVGANYFVASQGTGLLIYDSNWTLLGSFSATGVKSLAVLPTGNTVIIANGSSGAQIINTTNKASPALISTITPGTRNFQSVAISPTNSNYIALADSSGSVVVYSIATLASPSQVSSTAVAGSNFHAIGFASDGTTVYAAGNGSISGGLNYKGPLVEITNALTATPTLARTSYMPYGGESLAITSDQQYILVAGSVNGGLLVFSRQTLKVVASSLLNTTARGVAVCGTTTSPAGYFFALATDAGTYVFFFDPAAQSLTQVADLNNAAKSLLMDGAQLITGGTGIQAFDLSQQSVSLNPMFNTSVSVYGSDGAQQEEDQPIWIMPTPAYQAPASNQPYQLGIASSISAGQITQGVGVTANISFSDSNAVISVPSYPDVTVIISPGQLTATSNVYGVANLNALLANIQVTSAAASLTASCSFTDQVHTVIQSNVSFSPQHTLFLNANSGFSSVYSGNTNTFANLGSINSPATQATVVISIPAAQMTAANVTVFTTTAASGATVTYQSGSITITGTPSAVNATLANGITLRANNIDFAGALSLNMTAADNINGSGYQVTSATSVSLQALPNTVPAYSGGYSVPNIVAGNSVTINLAALFSSADGRPVTLSVNLSNFPAGMASYNASTGLLTVSTQALIQQAGTYNFAVTATNGNQQLTQTFQANVQPPPYATPVWSSTITTKTKVAGSAESFSLGTVTSSDGRTSTYSLAVLDQSNQPVSGTWYSINSTTGVVSLTSSLPAGSYTLRVTAQNGSASATSDLNLTVMPALTAAVAPSVSLQQAAVGTAFSFTVPAFTSITSGATTTDSFTNLPTGWSYNASTRVLTGTPTKTMSTLALTEAFTVSRTNPETNQLESFTTNLTLNVQVQPSLAMSNFAQTVSGGISTQALSVVNNTLAITTPASNLTAILQVSTSSASLQLTASGAAAVTQPSAGVYQVTGPKADVVNTLKTLKALVNNVDFSGNVAISATIQDGVNNDVTQTITAQFQPLPYATPVWSSTSLTTKTKVAGSAESFSLGTVTSSDGRTSTYSLAVLDQSNQPVSGAWYSINGTTGVVSLTAGLPAGNYTLRVTAQNGNASATSDLNLTVMPALTAAVAPSVSLQQAAVGTAFSFTVPAFTSITSGATTTDGFTNLPTGWSYDASTRVLTGTPTKTMSMLALTEAFTVSRTNPETNQLESFTTNLTLNFQVQPSLAMSNFAQTVSGGISTQALSIINNTLAITTPASNLTAILQANVSASLQLTASGAAVVSQPSAGVCQVTGPKADVIATLKTLKAQVSDVDFAGDVAISATIQDGVNNDVTQTITAQFQPLPYATPVWSNTSLTTKTKVAGSAESFSLGTVTSSDGRTSTYSLVVLDQSNQPVSGAWYSINSTTGVVSLTAGLPAGNYTLRVTAQNGSASTASDLNLTVLPVLAAAIAPSVSLQQAAVGTAFSFTVPAFTSITSGATTTDSFTNLPTGWSYNTSTRVLTGIPTKTMSTLALTEAFTVSRTNPETNQLESFTTNLTLNVQVQPSLAISNFAQTVSGGISTQALSVVNNTLAITTPASNLTAILQISTSSASLQLTASGAAVVTQPSAGVYQVTGPKADVIATLKTLKAQVSNVDFAGDVAISATIQDGVNNDVTQTITAQFQPLPYATPVWSNASLTTKTKVAGSAESFSLGTVTSSDGRTSTYSL
ncbi:MAG: hypothetical protein K0S08_1786, partial [Gammaproteobacteria bacterium]|nr:hypothetical protein [Gammaproteobacteria bacterium]